MPLTPSWGVSSAKMAPASGMLKNADSAAPPPASDMTRIAGVSARPQTARAKAAPMMPPSVTMGASGPTEMPPAAVIVVRRIMGPKLAPDGDGARSGRCTESIHSSTFDVGAMHSPSRLMPCAPS